MAENKMITIIWEAEDGYAGRARPQTLKVDIDEFEYCESPSEIMDMVDELVQSDFESKIRPEYELTEERAREIYDEMKQELFGPKPAES